MIPATTDVPVQQTLLSALMRPQCYPHATDAIERVETHISTVLLTGSYAYKIKKPVDLGFLDFSTLALRRHFCEEELRLNRRLAPDLYLDVVAVRGAPTAPCIGSADAEDAIEYAVKMRQFDQSGLLDRLIVENGLAAKEVDALADVVADFHARAARAQGGDRRGAPATQEAIIRQNFSHIRALATDPALQSRLDAIERWSEAMHGALAPAMAQRQREGYVRECHGDLHLGNIVLIDGVPMVFDCIEFNDELRWIDIANEIAFLVMDFTERGHPDLGARFLNAYWEINGDYGAARLLSYYLTYRAMVRAKVACIRAHQCGLDDVARDRATAEFEAYLRLAEQFTRPRRACLIVTHGVSGSGKTTATQPLLERLGAVRLRSDLERKRLHGVAGKARSGSGLDAGLYTEAATQATYDELHRLARLLIEAGWPVIVDATFLRNRHRRRFRELAKETGIPFLLLDFRADPAELRRRVERRSAAGTDASEATVEVLDRQLANAEPLSLAEQEEAVVIGDDDADSIVEKVFGELVIASEAKQSMAAKPRA